MKNVTFDNFPLVPPAIFEGVLLKSKRFYQLNHSPRPVSLLYLLFWLISLHLQPGFSISQLNAATVVDSTKFSALRFQQDYNSYQWQFLVRHSWLLQPGMRFNLKHDFVSSLLNMGSQGKKWKDNQLIDLELQYFIRPQLALKSNISSLYFIDHQTGFLNDLNIYSAMAGLDYAQLLQNHKSNLFISPTIGVKLDKRYNFVDRGMACSFDFKLQEYELESYYNTLSVNFQTNDLGPRKNRNAYLFNQIHKQFYKETSDTLVFMVDQKRRDYYLSAAGEIESLDEQVTLARNKLHYHLADGINVHLANEVNNRKVQVTPFKAGSTTSGQTRERTDFQFDNRLLFRYQREKLSGSFDLKYRSQEQTYNSPTAATALLLFRRVAFVAPDNNSRFLSMAALLGWRVFTSDSLSVGTTISRLQYDTPDTNNYDDRDELRIDLKMTEVHFFSPVLSLKIDAIVSLYHLVYIFGERSADNNWNRIFRLKPQFYYNLLQTLSLQQNFEVMANYVDYDFEFDQNDVRSFVYRKFASESIVNWRFSSRNQIHLSYRFEQEENGKLFWDRWSERPLLTRNNIWLRFNLLYSLRAYFTIMPGINFYSRDEWKFSSTREGKLKKEKYRDFVSIGPMLNILCNHPGKIGFNFSLSRYKITGNQNKKYYINNINLALNWNF